MVFILFFQGDQLRKRVRKICEGFQATLYECPETAAERQEMSVAVKQRIVDLQSVLQTTREHSSVQFNSIAKELETWKTKVCMCVNITWHDAGYIISKSCEVKS